MKLESILMGLDLREVTNVENLSLLISHNTEFLLVITYIFFYVA